MAIKDGGPAYPTSQPFQDEGMSLRDYFAGQALAGLLVNGYYDPDGAASDAYGFADAMLKARQKATSDQTKDETYRAAPGVPAHPASGADFS